MEIDEFLTKLTSKEITELDTFRSLTRNLVVNALRVLDELEGACEICGESREIAEKYHLLRHYLNYLKGFCEGTA